MIELKKYTDKKTAVLGLGKAGQAAVEALRASGAEVFVWDDKITNHENLGDDYNNWPWEELSIVVASPGVPYKCAKMHPVLALAQKHNVRIVGEVELLFEACPEAFFVGITGTNGKSTTTALIGHILKNIEGEESTVQIGGNLGTPALALEMLGEGEVYVLEMSSYQLDLLSNSVFDIACLTNITPDHLDRHDGMAGYIAAKERIFAGQVAGEHIAVIAGDDEYCQKIAKKLPEDLVMEVHADEVIKDDDKEFSLRNCLGLQGKHNWQNAQIAAAACRALGLDLEDIYAAMQSFAGLPHRMERVCDKNGILYVNDSKATNAESTVCALNTYDQNVYWIVGGLAKEGGITSLEKYFPQIKHAFLIGASAEEFAKTLEGKLAYTNCETLENATRTATEMAKNSSDKAVILLSPAAASFDQWSGFEARGDAFRELVSNYQGNFTNR